VSEQTQRRSRWIGAFQSRHQRSAARCRFHALHIETRATEVLLDHVARPDLLTRLGATVVHACVANARLQQFDGIPGALVHDSNVTGSVQFLVACALSISGIRMASSGGSPHCPGDTTGCPS
jgi:hypothetical protein